METTPLIYKYQADYDLLTTVCPPVSYVGRALMAYRWVFDSMNDPANFTSQYHKKPQRYLVKADAEKCSAMALSMFESLAGAQDRFAELKEDIGEKIYNTLGTHVASGQITVEDGVNGRPGNHGHFNHHCCLNCHYEQRFSIIARL